jgi:hypothetical protein
MTLVAAPPRLVASAAGPAGPVAATAGLLLLGMTAVWATGPSPSGIDFGRRMVGVTSPPVLVSLPLAYT